MSDVLAQIESYVPASVLIWFAVSSVVSTPLCPLKKAFFAKREWMQNIWAIPCAICFRREIAARRVRRSAS